ncbi:hypothetical protein P154DRAFT_532506 [Amniculicola lignicola CBS 123094]|uniref:Protein PNS1 n=1 Tax=Amniculicola lignicola CBS 123094 TaxID=1392246 RepID=A0A6A5WQ12_9PLEO|nr:hypothetical protein P154DRAFT_532506 [Amniculicola lignicola CBS 123094]
MFSEYASKFLSQSQSRLSLGQPDTPFTRNHPSDRQRPHSRSRGTPAYQQQQRRNMPNPYSSQGLSRFAFASRTSNAPAPLFYSATDDFREEDDHEEHDREMADHYALQRSRRQFGASNLSESSEVDDDMQQRSDHTIDGGSIENDAPGYGLGRGIKSSWTGDRAALRGRSETVERLEDHDHEEREQSVPLSESSGPSSKGRGRLVDVELASTVRGSIEELDRDEIMREVDDRPPSFQQFRNMPKTKRIRSPLRTQLPIPEETDEDTLLHNPPMSPDREIVPQDIPVSPIVAPKHNFFWAELFVIAQCAIFGIYLLSMLQDSAPDKKNPLGDTIYTVLRSSFHLIGIYSLVSILVGLLWLSLLRSFARPLIMLILIAVPVISFSFFLYPFIWSIKGDSHGNNVQDKLMRWLSFGPLLFCVFWCYTIWKGRKSLQKAADMLEFSGTILRAQSPLILVGIATLATVVLWSWIWMLMFTHLFLGGHFNSKNRWVIDLGTWWLGAAFFMDYFWTLSVIAGVQRATTAATVSQWYFHRNSVPAPSSRVVVQASLHHATTTMIGTICLSTLVALLIRLPLIVLPRRIAGLISMCAYSLVPTSAAAITNPLTLTYASIHGQPLASAARGLSNMSFISSAASPSTTLGPRSFSNHAQPSILSYRLAKLLLHAIRWIITLALGFGGWVSTAKVLQVGNETYRGSLYAYVVGLISAAIGWGALGAMEGVLGGILDALLVCWGSEVGSDGSGNARYCVDAGRLFGDEVPGHGRGRYEV